MFRQRLVTSLIFVPIVLWSILFAPATFLIGLVAALVIVASMEWIKLIPWQGLLSYTYPLLMLLMVWVCGEWYSFWLYVGGIAWGAIAIAVYTYPASMPWWGKKPIVFAAGLWVIPLWVQSLKMIYLLPNGRWYLLTLLLLIWAADVGAYLVGRALGHTKLLPLVSPGKTREGVLGGMLFSFGTILVCAYSLKLNIQFQMAFGVMILVPVSIVGDLFMSMLKRRVGLKDTGKILPGHGGLLDRFDSLIAAAPFYYWGLSFTLG